MLAASGGECEGCLGLLHHVARRTSHEPQSRHRYGQRAAQGEDMVCDSVAVQCVTNRHRAFGRHRYREIRGGHAGCCCHAEREAENKG